jgi:protein-S-isoprenylcysteine O-methyltransferase Ste14
MLAFAYGLAAYGLFLVVFLYAIAFVANANFTVAGLHIVPKTIDRGGLGNGDLTAVAVLVDVALLMLFAVQHSAMARAGFKRWWTKYVPAAVERSTYVLAASVCLAVLMALWFPITATVWDVTARPWRELLVAVSLAGWGIVLVSTFLINHFDLFGLRQVYTRLREMPPRPYAFVTPAFYGIVRHPIYLGFVVAFWATPAMTVGHLLFAVATTGYILVAIQLEERDLVRAFGQQYLEYRTQVAMLLPGVHRPS